MLRAARTLTTTNNVARAAANMKLLYPTSLKLNVQSIEGFSASLHAYDVKKPIPDDLIDATSSSPGRTRPTTSRMPPPA